MAQRTQPSDLIRLQSDVEHIRNFCILAHVDHGKTTLSDSLVSSNGFISARLAGKLRFLDSTEEEQKRGITMHSSAIALSYRLKEEREKEKDTAAAESEEFLVNLVDSPGHIDFSSDVSTAARLCDGALVVVDVLEGVCTQTHAVVYKALRERMRPCLVLNKVDRLAVELRLTPREAFQHLRRLVENVNALAATLVRSELMALEQQQTATHTPSDTHTTHTHNTHTQHDTHDDAHPLIVEWTFSPDKGNVQFASALDGWSFGLMRFVNYWHRRLQLNKTVLRKYLFDDYALNAQTKKILKCDATSSDDLPPMFVSLVLEPLWEMYETVLVHGELKRAVDIAKEKYNIELPPREVNARDPRATLQSIMRRWLPLSDSVLRMVVKNMPNPREAQHTRLHTLLPHTQQIPLTAPTQQQQQQQQQGESVCDVSSLRAQAETLLHTHTARVQESIDRCDASSSAPLVVFVSKMMPVRVAELSQRDLAMLNARRAARDEPLPPLRSDQEVFLALGRVFSGRLTRRSALYVMGHKYDPHTLVAQREKEWAKEVDAQRVPLSLTEDVPVELRDSLTKIEPSQDADHLGCYILLGPSVFPTEDVGAGNIVGIVGLEEHVLKTATLSDSWACSPLKAITFQSKPMLKVAVEPVSHKDLRRLETGLQQLFQFDPVVEIGVDDNGEHTMTCLGELHLDQCVKALIEKFAQCEIKVSEPIVSFRETVVPFEESDLSLPAAAPSLPPPWGDLPGLQHARRGRVRIALDADNVALTVRCFPLPVDAANVLEQDATAAARFDEFLSRSLYEEVQQRSAANGPPNGSPHANAPLLDRVSLFQRESPQDAQSFAASTWPRFVSSSLASDGGHGAVVAAALGAQDEKEKEKSSEDKDKESHKSDVKKEDEARQRVAAVLAQNTLSLAPKNCPANLLVFHRDVAFDVLDGFSLTARESERESENGSETQQPIAAVRLSQDRDAFLKLWARLHSAVVAGFHAATAAGPLMNEPMYGVAFCVEKVEIVKPLVDAVLSERERERVFGAATAATLTHTSAAEDESKLLSTATSVHTGQLISAVKDALRLAMLSCPVRIVEALYQCDLQCDQSQLGNLYAVLSRRRGAVFEEDIIEGTSMFLLSAHLPVAQSFQFAQELLKKTSGSGTAPQLSFSHWRLMEQDPFWRPRTEEELEEFGEQFLDEHNLTKAWVNKIRKRKGLAVDEQVVAVAEKQRTLSRKK